MTFLRVLLAWAATSGVFLAWRALESGVRGGQPLGAALKASLGAVAAEAALVTLLAGLWFASLGSGGGWLVFLLVGLVVEVSPRLRGAEGRAGLTWKPVVGGVLRMMLAGVACGLIMRF
ncbi:MAG: hypothetical protein IPK12_03455 [Gemmatimonadetes bacterium]|nr:hypothetical protein [Gemmatimonadota bacterium]